MRIYYAKDGNRQYQFMSIQDRNKWIAEKEGRRILTSLELHKNFRDRKNKS